MERLKSIFLSKPAKIVYAIVIVLAYAAAAIAGIVVPCLSGAGVWAVPISLAVALAAPVYYKAFLWCRKV